MAPSVRKSSVDACPDLETLAGYLDGRLTERERADIAAHVAGCETCYFVFTEAAQTRASDRARAELDANVVPAPTPLARSTMVDHAKDLMVGGGWPCRCRHGRHRGRNRPGAVG
jgi:anti-sigma factor RsiW